MPLSSVNRAIEAATLKRGGASLTEIAKFWNPNKPLTRQRLSQIVKRGEFYLQRKENPLTVKDLPREQIVTKDIAIRLGARARLARNLDAMGYSVSQLDAMLICDRDTLINHEDFGLRSFNELARIFGRKIWDRTYVRKYKYGV